MFSESTFALALLAVVMVFVVAGVAFQHARLYRVAGLLPDDRIAPFRHHLLASAAAIALVVVFWLALGALSWRPPIETTASLEIPAEGVHGTSADETTARVVVDGLDPVPAVASAD